MAQKQGISADLFVWIFATVAGALLLFFFITLSSSHITTSTLVEDYQLIASFKQQFFSLGTTDEISKTLTFPRALGLHVTCDTLFTSKANQKHTLFLFSSSLLEGQRYALVGRPWNFPFYITTFYYLVPEKSLVLLVYDPSAASFVDSLDLPASLPIRKIPLSSYNLRSLQPSLAAYQQLTFVFFGQSPDTAALFTTFKAATVHVLRVDIPKQTLTFFPSSDSYPYFGDTMLLGAFFGPENYGCLSKKALDRLHLLASLYQQKVFHLQQKVASGGICQQRLIQAGSLLSTLSSISAEDLSPATASLQQLQKELTQNACPPIY